MKIVATVKADNTPREEVGFIHENGALILKTKDGCVVLGGVGGNYFTSSTKYEYWKRISRQTIYSTDLVELSFQ